MHHALRIQEVLRNIFDHYSLPALDSGYHKEDTSCLAALARTCRVFKEPALDALWKVLGNASPLVRCLPDACQLSMERDFLSLYSFNRPLTQSERDTLRSYTRRIRSIQSITQLDCSSVMAFLSHPTTQPLFPNLRYLRCRYTKDTACLLDLPLPSLIDLHIVRCDSKYLFRNPINAFPKFSPNIQRLSITLYRFGPEFRQIGSSYIARWQNLRAVIFRSVALDGDALVHLSRMPALTELRVALDVTFDASNQSLVFSNLHNLAVQSGSLDPVSRLLSHTRLPALANFDVCIYSRPSRQQLASFLTSLCASGAGHTIETLALYEEFPSEANDGETLLLGLEDLRPCMAFKNLRRLDLGIEWEVDMRDSDVLALASSWPKIEQLLINLDACWGSQGGITPGALVQLLRTCRSLSRMAVRLDTRGYTEVPPGQVQELLVSTLPPELSIYVLDADLEPESMPAITTFFCILATRVESQFSLQTWQGMAHCPNSGYPQEHWNEVLDQINQVRGFESESESESEGL